MVVVFDMDDTLFPEEAFVRSALTAAGRHAESVWGVEGFSKGLERLFIEGRRGNLFQLAWLNLAHVPLDDAKSAELLRVYREHRPDCLPWFPDAAAVMDEIYAQHPLELISDGYLPTQANKFAALRASRWIKQPIFTESLGRAFWKPSPRAFELVMSRHPGAPCAYIADNPSKDFVAPNALGWLTVQVARPGGVHASSQVATGGTPNLVMSDLFGLPSLLNQ